MKHWYIFAVRRISHHILSTCSDKQYCEHYSLAFNWTCHLINHLHQVPLSEYSRLMSFFQNIIMQIYKDSSRPLVSKLEYAMLILSRHQAQKTPVKTFPRKWHQDALRKTLYFVTQAKLAHDNSMHYDFGKALYWLKEIEFAFDSISKEDYPEIKLELRNIATILDQLPESMLTNSVRQLARLLKDNHHTN